jgi:hypothetical protein
MPQNLSAEFVSPSPKVLDFNEKRLHWASVVHDLTHFKFLGQKSKEYCINFFRGRMKKKIRFGNLLTFR